MQPTSLNTFLDQFLAAADLGFGLVAINVAFILNALIAVSIVLATFQWIITHESPISSFLRRVVMIAVIATIVNNWGVIAPLINGSGARLGLAIGGGSFTVPDLHNPGRIGQVGAELFGRTVALGEGMSISVDFIPLATIFLAALVVMLGFFALAVQLFLTLISFKIGSLIAFILLPWGVFSGTAWIAERPLAWVLVSAARLLVLAFIASVSMRYVATLPATFTLDLGGALNILLFGLAVLGLALIGPALAKEVVEGRPNLSGMRR